MRADPGPTPRLRVVTRGEFATDGLQQRAQRDLGFPIEFVIAEGAEGLRQIVAQPETFDIYHQWHTTDLIWTARCIQAIDLSRLVLGARVRAAASAPGLNPVFRRLFVQPDGTLGDAPSDMIAVLPIAHGVDGFAWLPSQAPGLRAGEPESWGWMLDSRWSGHVALIGDAVLGMIEAALAMEAHQRRPFGDIGNLTIDEIDEISDYLIHKKKIGHFKGFWNSGEDAVRLVARGGVTIQSAFSPAVSQLRAQGVGMRVSTPVEGCRGWHTDLCISAAAEGDALEAAYAYLNWWQNGWGGAHLSRQGYYFVFPDVARPLLSAEEWAYWYDGQPAATDLCDPFGRKTIAAGARREGGSLRERLSRIRVWNTFMDEHAHLTRRWNEFLSA